MTGSGKTLVLHVNLWQVHHYLAHGAHPEALVRRADRQRTFDAVLLVTPNEGLSRQHIAEFQASGIEAGLLVENRSPQRTFEPRVDVIEITKLAEAASRDGVSIPMDELKDMNLVFVDEGHKGNASEERVFKERQWRIGANGFILEYSATFAQAIAAAIREVEALTKNAAFKTKKMTLGAFMLTETDKQKIPGAENKTWSELETECRLLNQRDAGYMERIFASCLV